MPSPPILWHHRPTVMTMRWNTVPTCRLPTPRPHRLQHSVLHPLLTLEIQGNHPSPRPEYVPIRGLAWNKMSLSETGKDCSKEYLFGPNNMSSGISGLRNTECLPICELTTSGVLFGSMISHLKRCNDQCKHIQRRVMRQIKHRKIILLKETVVLILEK